MKLKQNHKETTFKITIEGKIRMIFEIHFLKLKNNRFTVTVTKQTQSIEVNIKYIRLKVWICLSV